MDYTQLVLVRHAEHGKTYLLEAPVKADIKDGDVLVLELRNGEMAYGIAVGTTFVKRCSQAYRFVLASCNALEPLSKVKGKYIEVKF